MDNEAVRQALYTLARGIKELGDALADTPPQNTTKTQREIALLLEFHRPPGQGLTQEEASKACKKHAFTPQTVGAWARADYLRTDKTEDRRYLTGAGRAWLIEQGVELS